jgi:WD40 repeat protein
MASQNDDTQEKTGITAKELNLCGVIGFNGKVLDGLILHPDNETLIFPIGCQIIIRNVLTRKDQFLKGHTNDINTLTVSNSGKYLVSGEKTFSGFKANIIIWDLQTLQIVHKLTIHKVVIQSLSFSFDDKYLVSLGGVDDNYLIVWDIQTGKALCGNVAGTDFVRQVKFFNKSNDMLITCQNFGIKIWKVDYIAKKLISTDVNFATLKRQVLCMVIEPNDQFAYVGTKSGDVLEISLKNAIYKRIGPLMKLYPGGINTIKILPNKDLLIGSNEGDLALIGFNDFKVKKEVKVLGGVTSISLTAEGAYFFCATHMSNIYWVETKTLKNEIRNTCHNDKVNDIRFPYDYSEVFGTCGKEDIRIWNSDTKQEYLRIHVPNLECYCFNFMRNGKSIYSGWSDGKIRAFLPISGKLIYTINDAHANGVTSICGSSCGNKIVSGGINGEIRVWQITNNFQKMEASLKEHRGRITSIIVNSSDSCAVSASTDGSCIIWDIKNYVRLACLFEKTLFKDLVYHPSESQILTVGTNKKISYWNCEDSNAEKLRSVEGALEGEINSIAMCDSGEYFVTSGSDKEVKIWEYQTGFPIWKGMGHSNPINKIAIAPNQKIIVSVSEDGSIFFWESPKEIILPKKDYNKPL